MGIGSCGGHWLRGLVDTVAGWWLWQSVGCMCLPAAIHGRNLLLWDRWGRAARMSGTWEAGVMKAVERRF